MIIVEWKKNIDTPILNYTIININNILIYRKLQQKNSGLERRNFETLKMYGRR